jgi:hypothetical protein
MLKMADEKAYIERHRQMPNTGCGSCGMLVDPPNAFHPYLYCELFKLGVTNPAQFLSGQAFIPDPNYWGKDAPGKQVEAARARAKLVR